jgi:2-hydroxychromene-2-carboxylate isomerase
MHVQFILDYRSPYAYLANTQVKALGVDIDYQPIDILAVMKQVNNQPSPACPPKAKYAAADALRWAKYYGVPYSPNRTLLEGLRQGHLPNTLLSRAGIAAQQMGIFERVNDALFGAVWAGSDDLVTKAGRSRFLAHRAIPQELWNLAESADVEERLVASSNCAVQRGVFGVPTFFVDSEMFFGNDRLTFVRTHLRTANNGVGMARDSADRDKIETPTHCGGNLPLRHT